MEILSQSPRISPSRNHQQLWSMHQPSIFLPRVNGHDFFFFFETDLFVSLICFAFVSCCQVALTTLLTIFSAFQTEERMQSVAWKPQVNTSADNVEIAEVPPLMFVQTLKSFHTFAISVINMVVPPPCSAFQKLFCLPKMVF